MLSKDTRKFWVFITCLSLWCLNMGTLISLTDISRASSFAQNMVGAQVLSWTVVVILFGTWWAKEIDHYG